MHPKVERHARHLRLVVKALKRFSPQGVSALAGIGNPPAGETAGKGFSAERYATNAFLALEHSPGMPEVAVV